MRRLPRPVYIAKRTMVALGQVGSRFINATFLDGSTRQSVSARAYIEQWPKGRARIDAFFGLFGQADHCAESWTAEVTDALKTLERNNALQSLQGDKQ